MPPGPALLIILALIVRKVSKFDPGKEAIQAVGKIVAYAMFANIFLLGLEFSRRSTARSGHMHPFGHLYAHSETPLVPMMWLSTVLAVVSLTMLFFPRIRKNEGTLALACIMLFVSLWIDKGFGLIIGGFVPNPSRKCTNTGPRSLRR